jgi:hypothetical protein
MPRLILDAVEAFTPPHDESPDVHHTWVSVTKDNGQPLNDGVQWTIVTLRKPPNGSDVTATQAGTGGNGYHLLPLEPGPKHWQKGPYVLGLIAEFAEATGVGPNNLPKFTLHHGQTILRFAVT